MMSTSYIPIALSKWISCFRHEMYFKTNANIESQDIIICRLFFRKAKCWNGVSRKGRDENTKRSLSNAYVIY